MSDLPSEEHQPLSDNPSSNSVHLGGRYNIQNNAHIHVPDRLERQAQAFAIVARESPKHGDLFMDLIKETTQASLAEFRADKAAQRTLRDAYTQAKIAQENGKTQEILRRVVQMRTRNYVNIACVLLGAITLTIFLLSGASVFPVDSILKQWLPWLFASVHFDGRSQYSDAAQTAWLGRNDFT